MGTLCVLGPSGRMGGAVIAAAGRAGLEVAATVDEGQDLAAGIAAADVYIDFTTPAATRAAAAAATRLGKAAVIGTTGLDAAAQAAIAALAAVAPVVVAANFSLGVNVVLGLVQRAARALPAWDAEIVELHHHHKRDAPSGTALALGRAIADGRGVAYDDVHRHARDGEVGARPPGEIGVVAVRGGDVVGEHTAFFFGAGERVEISHRATDRSIFAVGAVRAAAWAAGQPPGRYDMLDVLGSAMTDFPDGVALVAGGSGGIGRAIAEALAAAGARVALTYRRRRELAEEVAAGIGASIHPLNLTDAAAVAATVDAVAAAHGPLHTVVHAVGSDLPMRFVSQVTADEWRDIVHADADGFFHLMRAALPHLRQARGSIVAITSAGLDRHPARDVLSTAPKAAIEAVIRGLAREEGRFGVRANSVAVGVVDAGIFQRLAATELSPAWVEAARKNAALGRLGTAAEVADAVVFLASRRASYITGQRLTVDGGYGV